MSFPDINKRLVINTGAVCLLVILALLGFWFGHTPPTWVRPINAKPSHAYIDRFDYMIGDWEIGPMKTSDENVHITVFNESPEKLKWVGNINLDAAPVRVNQVQKEKIHIGGSRPDWEMQNGVEVEFIAIGHHIPSDSDDLYEQPIPFFDPITHERWDESQLPAKARVTRSAPTYKPPEKSEPPTIRFVFQIRNASKFTPRLLLVDRLVSDSPRVSFGGIKQEGEFVWFDHEQFQWDNAPIRFVFELLTQSDSTPALEVELPYQVGATATSPDTSFQIGIEEIVPGKWKGTRSSRGGEMKAELEKEPNSENSFNTAILTFNPHYLGNSLEMFVRLKFGETEQLQHRIDSAATNYSLEHPAEEISSLVFRQLPFRCRFDLEVIDLPGVIDENRDVENLFDITVPWVVVDDFSKLTKLVTTATHTSINSSRVVEEANHFAIEFPREYRMVTLQELARDLDSCYPRPLVLNTYYSFEMENRPNWFQRAKTWTLDLIQ